MACHDSYVIEGMDFCEKCIRSSMNNNKLSLFDYEQILAFSVQTKLSLNLFREILKRTNPNNPFICKNIEDDYTSDPIYLIHKIGHYASLPYLKILLEEHPNVDFNIKDVYGETCLSYLCRVYDGENYKKKLKCLNIILQNGNINQSTIDSIILQNDNVPKKFMKKLEEWKK